jgi:DNA primase
MTNRVVFPIRNENGGLLTLKGRTLESDYKILGIPKYFVYYEIETSHVLFGEFENKDYIKKADYIILVESEKSVMKLWQMGYRNCVAIGRKSISRQQRNKLLSYGKPIVIAFDNDVKEKELQIISRMFKGLIPVSYTLDRFNLLNEKDSPCDNGLHIFEQLLETRIEFI